MLLFFIRQTFAQELCPSQINLENVMEAQKSYLRFWEKLDSLHVEPTINLNGKELIYFKKITVQELLPDVELYSDLIGKLCLAEGLIPLRFKGTERYLLQKLVKEFNLSKKLLLILYYKNNELIWAPGLRTFFQLNEKYQIEEAIRIANNSIKQRIPFRYHIKNDIHVAYPVDDQIDYNDFLNPICSEGKTALYEHSYIIRAKTAREILKFKAKLRNDKNFVTKQFDEIVKEMHNVTSYIECQNNTVKLFENNYNFEFDNKSFKFMLNDEITRAIYVNETWIENSKKVLEVKQKVEMAMKILNLPYYKHNSRKEDIFYDGFFDRVNEGYVAEIFSLAFFVALALIFIITCFAMYFCGLKNCMKTCWTLFCSRQATTQAQPPVPILSNFQPLSLVPFTPQDSHMFRESRRGGDRPRLAIQ